MEVLELSLGLDEATSMDEIGLRALAFSDGRMEVIDAFSAPQSTDSREDLASKPLSLMSSINTFL